MIESSKERKKKRMKNNLKEKYTRLFAVSRARSVSCRVFHERLDAVCSYVRSAVGNVASSVRDNGTFRWGMHSALTEKKQKENL